MAVGKFLRYLVMTSLLLWVFPQDWASGLSQVFLSMSATGPIP